MYLGNLKGVFRISYCTSCSGLICTRYNVHVDYENDNENLIRGHTILFFAEVARLLCLTKITFSSNYLTLLTDNDHNTDATCCDKRAV